MLDFALSECGLSIERFFELSWYEWSVEVKKVYLHRDEIHRVWEGNASLIRDLMALTANCNRDPKKQPEPYKGSDFIRLSFDKEEPKDRLHFLSPEEVLEHAKNFGKPKVA